MDADGIFDWTGQIAFPLHGGQKLRRVLKTRHAVVCVAFAHPYLELLFG